MESVHQRTSLDVTLVFWLQARLYEIKEATRATDRLYEKYRDWSCSYAIKRIGLEKTGQGYKRSIADTIKGWYRAVVQGSLGRPRSFIERCERTSEIICGYDELASKQWLMTVELPKGISLQSFMAVTVTIGVWIDNATEGDEILLSERGCLERGSGLVLCFRDQEPFLVNDGTIISHAIDNWAQWREVVDTVLYCMQERPYFQLRKEDQLILRLAYVIMYQPTSNQFQIPHG